MSIRAQHAYWRVALPRGPVADCARPAAHGANEIVRRGGKEGACADGGRALPDKADQVTLKGVAAAGFDNGQIPR